MSRLIKIGRVFKCKDSGEIYILAQTKELECQLIGLITGNRWDAPVKVRNPGKIRDSEWLVISGANFESIPLGTIINLESK